MNRRSWVKDEGQRFPFYIYQTGRLAAVEQHDHDFWEIVYIYEGRGTCMVGDQTIEFHSRQLILTPPFVPHMFKSHAHHLHRQVSIAAYESVLEQLPFLWAHLKNTLARIERDQCFSVTVPDERVSDIEERIETIHREFLLRSRNYQAVIIFDLAYLLIAVDRFLSAGQDGFLLRKDLPLIVQRSLEIIETSYHSIQGLDDILRGIKVDWRYFIRIFKKHVGLTPIRYLNCVRIEKSCELLLRTHQPIVQIALDTGFNDLSYFNRQFKRFVGLTPSDFRNRAPRNAKLANCAKRFHFAGQPAPGKRILCGAGV